MLEAGGQGVGVGVAPCGVGAPAGGVVPAATAAALGQGDVPFLRDEEFGIKAEGEEAVHDAGGDEPVSGVFPEPPSGERLPGVSMPWPSSMRIFIAGFAFMFLLLSYTKSARKAKVSGILAGINGDFQIVFVTLRSMNRQVSYIVAVISDFAERFGLSNPQAYRYLARYKGIDFLQEFYDVEHTLSFDDVVADVALYCRNNGGALA